MLQSPRVSVLASRRLHQSELSRQRFRYERRWWAPPGRTLAIADEVEQKSPYFHCAGWPLKRQVRVDAVSQRLRPQALRQEAGMVTSTMSTPVMPISPTASRPDLPVNRTSDLALCSMAGTSNFASLSHALLAAHGRRKRTAAAARNGRHARRLSAGELHQLRADARSACERSPRACACALAIAAIASRSP